MENDITSSHINVFEQNLDMKCILTLLIILLQNYLKTWENFLICPNFPIFLEQMTIWKILVRNSRSGHTILNSFYVMPLPGFTLQKIEGFIDFLSPDMKD